MLERFKVVCIQVVCIQCNSGHIVGDDFKMSLLQLLQSFLCILCFAFC